MPVSTMREAAKLTNQQLADFALEEDRAARRARRRGDMAAAALHDRECTSIARLLK